jgi:diguanylate cyclase (GGDEF)-like protein/PAS domain S-box-containing protein
MDLDYRKLLFHIRDGVYFTDKDRRITYWNKSAERISGYSAEEVIGHHCSDNILIHVDENGHSLCRDRCPLAKAIESRVPREGHLFLHHKEGHRVPVNVRVIPLVDNNGSVIGGAEFFSEAIDQEALQSRIEELEQLALIDPLTQLPNRIHVQTVLHSHFNEMKRIGISFGLLFLDIDHFKNFNDTYGHDTGDKILRILANTLKAAQRPYDLIGRWGGEEFVGIVRSVDKQQLAVIADRQRRLISESTIQYKDKRLNVTASIGATIVNSEDTEDSLVKRADHLMYQSKNNGRNRVTSD